MKGIKKLLNTKTKVIVAIVLLAILVTWLLLFFYARDTALALIEPLLWSLLLVAVCWLAIHYGVKAWRKRKRSEFDEKIAAKEGIEDRRREWATWTEELEKQGIDRYELPFYLLVGEPQSGKSVLLHNSDLHFPFGQNRLSGVGGTRGCDWWFTEEAVVLDLAGRLFTHEGGAADRVEFEAFLELLSEFRPLCPANGVILVIPCDSLLTDDADQCALKATKIQNALLTLTTKLQAQLPIYLVLTKADQIFGFAESVHRLDVERRHEMFGWSRSAEKIDSPFDIKEVVDGFEEMVGRARLLRAHMMAGARVPEALPEVDRLVAFPHEFEGLRGNLETYLKRIFTASNITDRVFFRGVYLTSGLQSGVPIAKVCTELFGATGEADLRNLEALFSKPRAYFIKDLIRSRVFGERGLVRPTQGRVQQTRRASVLGYGFAGVVVLSAIVLGAAHLLKDKNPERAQIYKDALEQTEKCVAKAPDSAQDLLYPLHLLADAATQEEDAAEKAFRDPREDFKRLYCHLFDAQLVPLLKQEALSTIESRLDHGFGSFKEMKESCDALSELSEDLDFRDASARDAIVKLLSSFSSLKKTPAGTEPLNLARAFELRMSWNMWDETRLLSPVRQNELGFLQGLCGRALGEIENCLNPGATTQPEGEFGYMLAWFGAESAHNELRKSEIVTSGRVLALCARFSDSMKKVVELEKKVGSASSGKRVIKFADLGVQGARINALRQQFKAMAEGERGRSEEMPPWTSMVDLMYFISQKFEGHFDGGFRLSSVGMHFGAEDAGQTGFVMTESLLGMVQGKIEIGPDADYNPQDELKSKEKALLAVADERLPADLRAGGLENLAARIEQLHARTLLESTTGAAPRAFQGQIIEVASLFRDQVTGPRDAIQCVTGATEVGPGLSYPTLVELVSLHGNLGRIIKERLQGVAKDDAIEWQRRVEKVLFEHLQASESDSKLTWVPPSTAEGFAPEAWEILGALGRAAKLEQVSRGTYAVDAAATRLQSKVFFHLADKLLDEWNNRTEVVRETMRITDELGKLASNVKNMPNAAGLERRKLSEWSDRLDNLLKRHLGDLEKKLAEIWEPRLVSGPFSTVLSNAIAIIEDLDEKIGRSHDAGMNGLGEVVEDLSASGDVKSWLTLPNSDALIAKLREWEIPGQASHVQRQTEYAGLRDALQNVRNMSVSAGGGQALAVSYASYFRTRPPDSPAENAGIRMVRSVRSQFAIVLRAEVRTKYLDELESLVYQTKYEPLFEVLFWRPESEGEFRFKDVEKKLSDLFRRNGGDFDKLRKSFSLIATKEGDGIEQEIFPDPIPEDEGTWGAIHRFLLGLREFMLAEDANTFRGASISFLLTPHQMTGSVWDLGGIPKEARRSSFWYPKGGSQDELEKAFLLPEMGDLSVSEWSLDSGSRDRKFQFYWSDKPVQSEAKADSNAYRFEIESSLGPMLLAWSGTALNEGPGSTEYAVVVKPKGTELEAPLDITFEKPLPVRPEKP